MVSERWLRQDWMSGRRELTGTTRSGDSVMSAQQTLQFGSSGSIPTSPHQFVIKEIDTKIACRLNNIWHSRLPNIKPHNVYNKYFVCYGLFLRTECYAIAIWSSPVARMLDNETLLELRRYAIKPEAPKNTASWGLKRMRLLIHKKFPKIKTLISYQDTSVHNGTIYKADNWNQVHRTKYQEWTRKSRPRNKVIANADKIRWEYDLTGGNFTPAGVVELGLNGSSADSPKVSCGKPIV